MKDALKSFALITFSVLFCTVLVWFYVRGRALNEPVPELISHAFLATNGTQAGPYLVAYKGSSTDKPENTFLAFDDAAALSPDIILWADIRPTKDGVLVAFREQELATTTDGKGWVGYTNYSEVAKLNAGYKFQDASGGFPFRDAGAKIPTLKELLERYPKHRFILNFRDYKPGIDSYISKVIDEANAGDRVLIQSEENGLLKDLREKKPSWLFGTSQAQITQFKMLASIGLEAVAPLKGDVYVSQVTRRGHELITDSILTELKRRKMKIFVGPVEDPTEAEHLRQKGVDGIISPRPSSMLDQVAR